jgi:methyltransferase (TIGR00027 family)
MKSDQASQTAGWVALARSLGRLLPQDQRLAYDPYGAAFVHGPLHGLAVALFAEPALLSVLLPRVPSVHAFLLWMQLRTRALDDVLLEFVASGGRQIVLLGAGFDCRAVRFAHLLGEANVFEVDHPRTQARKREVVTRGELRTPARYVSWDFERDDLGKLPARLEQEGLSAAHRVLTIWEGVTMYLSEPDIEASVAALRRLGAPGSWLAFNYVDRRALQRPLGDQRLQQRLAASVGEPHRFGWDPAALPTWLSERGLSLLSDVSDRDLAERHLKPDLWHHFTGRDRHVALARVR